MSTYHTPSPRHIQEWMAVLLAIAVLIFAVYGCGTPVEPVPMCRGLEVATTGDGLGSVYGPPVPCDNNVYKDTL